MTHETAIKPDMIIAEFQVKKTQLEREKIEEKARKPLGETARQGCLVTPDQSAVSLVPDNGEYMEAIDPPRPIVIPNYPA